MKPVEVVVSRGGDILSRKVVGAGKKMSIECTGNGTVLVASSTES